MTNENAPFYQGFAMACASVARDHDEPTLAANVMYGYGVTMEVLKRARVDDYDLVPLRKAMKRRPR